MTGGPYQLRSESIMRRVAATPALDDLYGDCIVMDRPAGDEPGEMTGIARGAGTCSVGGHRVALHRILPAHSISQATADYLLALHREHVRRHASLLAGPRRRIAEARSAPDEIAYVDRHLPDLQIAQRRYARLVDCLCALGLQTSNPACTPRAETTTAS